MSACLVLEDGTVFRGVRIGRRADAGGEVVFTTSMTGYQEVVSDPSYRGQIVAMAYPLIGNYGFSPAAWEAPGPHVAGFVVREGFGELDAFLRQHGVSGLAEVDTRRLVRHLREHGLQRGVITDEPGPDAVRRAAGVVPLGERNLVAEVSGAQMRVLPGPGPRIAVIDCGVKAGIITALRRRGAEVVLCPYDSDAASIAAVRPAGVVVSNGPGDPAVLATTIRTVGDLLGAYPLLGICLGHQLLALAVGGRTYKMTFGHRGSNQTVREIASGRVMITTQNHGYAVDPALPREVEITHINLNDGTVEGLRHRHLAAFSVQFHPEGRPGPGDAEELYDRFLEMVREGRRAGAR
ncbi:MAG: glutamine-hydrolyzing carbamoyl-phosphate synthase small subunit [Armatimonadota bacterium]|nr:glutamine-hydrolyzing carbamoyl-phosphate synthase small subunit [Armatimonadota bacterium]MDR7451247.1 glutamine-hydrolyzing carbamoyl-phosphate synthase small subunit [Armatimonadota bacterium]MDR7466850.1 glutamine-hydrolyzing carbamoyl-phosphate synthase small subunit [Armatimonadota bacterium]MDR7492677.1 glutamine-hydrolyzing carbamoyl-phosphate synthase small subunit [Armatimonadota bacterium]MDR7499606.1 glutamine-hydrolyzing carbamoyl-phosphate synthase small subunit [Armatimonadota